MVRRVSAREPRLSAALAVPSLVDVPVALIWVALALHLAGERQLRLRLARPRSAVARRRAWAFLAGLAVILVALLTPIDTLAPKLFWVHMTQHVLLLGVAAPLIVLGAPWLSLWRPLPLGLRRSVAGTLARSAALAPVRGAARWISRPAPAWLLFNVNLVAWHIPAAYDLTLRSAAAHAAEHLTFLLSAVLLWLQVLTSPPLRRRLGGLQRVLYILSASLPGWVLSLVLAFASSPLYPAYAHLVHRPGGISALADQQLAGGIMLGPGSLATTLFVFIGIYRWLGQDPDRSPQAARLARAGG